ncbi:620_t:CDS:1, partial [Funneliformis caledonium]
ATTNDASNSRRQLPFGNSQNIGETEGPTDATYTKRESKSRLTSTPLVDRETYNFDGTGDGQNQNNGNISQYNNFHRYDDHEAAAIRHNTLTL